MDFRKIIDDLVKALPCTKKSANMLSTIGFKALKWKVQFQPRNWQLSVKSGVFRTNVSAPNFALETQSVDF